MKNYTLDSQMENLIKYYNESITVLILISQILHFYLILSISYWPYLSPIQLYHKTYNIKYISITC